MIAGVCIGLNAGLISIVTEWLSDIKMGYCSDGWWLNQQFCCWEIESDETDVCTSWHPWSDVTAARWLIYVIFAVSFFFCLNASILKVKYFLARVYSRLWPDILSGL